jgi:hypothetical protein
VVVSPRETDLKAVATSTTYELQRFAAPEGKTMTITAMATYAYDQIDQARTELETASK